MHPHLDPTVAVSGLLAALGCLARFSAACLVPAADSFLVPPLNEATLLHLVRQTCHVQLEREMYVLAKSTILSMLSVRDRSFSGERPSCHRDLTH